MSTARLALAGLAAGAALLFWGGEPAAAERCTASIDNVLFGQIDTLAGGHIDTTANVTIHCSSGNGASVCAGIGAGSGGASNGSRFLTSASGARLRYELYQDSTRTVRWGSLEESSLGDVLRVLVPGGDASVTLPLYARIFGGQSGIAAGDYSAVFSGGQTGFFYGGISIGCSILLLGNVVRPSFEVRAQVANHCLVEADDLDFGTRGILSLAVSAATSLRVRCTPGTRYSISLGGGSGDSGLPRHMTHSDGVGRINYGLYSDQSHTRPWTTTSRVDGVGNGSTATIPVYGLVPPQPTPLAGRYTDVVVVTVTH